ncbi:MAG: DUF6305 family protein, partial [Candidatus Electryoneaceae bacterium]|nr:DUF6305 family protein [Candidatus Electryoneaceae bacterium]
MRILLTITVVLLTMMTATWAVEYAENEVVLYGQPILLTPAGQSAEGFMIRTMCMRLGIDVRYQPQATPDSLGDAKTLLLVAGGSSKGLGAAAIDE